MTRAFATLLVLFAAVAPWTPSPAEAQDQRKATVAITAPANGAVLASPTVDVDVAFSSGVEKNKDNQHVVALELRAEGRSVATYDVPDAVREGTHRFAAVGLASLARADGTVTLVARALLSDRGNHHQDSDPVRVTVRAGGDVVPPQITTLVPSAGSFTTNPRPTILAQISDAGGSGLDPASVVLRLDGIPVAAMVTLSGADAASLAFTPAADLSDGAHSFTVDAKDLAGNAGVQASSSFLVDRLAPAVSIGAPAAGFTNNALPFLAATVVDAGVGVVPAAVLVTLDGVPVTATVLVANATTLSVGFTPAAPLGEGPHTYEVRATDRAGNASSPASRTVTVDRTPPLVAITAPASGATFDPRPPLSAALSDDSSGIDPASVKVTLDGAGVAALVTATSASFTPSTNLAPGLHTYAVEARDLAGNGPVLASRTFTTVSVTLTLTQPSIPNGGFVNSAQPSFSATLTNPGGTGIDPASLVLRLDGTAVSATITIIDANTVTVAFTPPVLQSSSAHTITIDGRDGNGAPFSTISSSFSVDLSVPVLSNVTPLDGAVTNNPRPTFTATVSDSGGSGADPAGITLIVDSILVPADQAVVTPITPDLVTFSFTPSSDLLGGVRSFTFQAKDRAGNSAVPVSRSFTVATGGGLQLSAVTPSKAGVLARIQITGQGFSAPGQTIVTFSPSVDVGEFEVHTDTTLVLRVPENAVTGPLRVTAGGVQSAALPFEVVEASVPGVPVSSILFDSKGNPIVATCDLVVSFLGFAGADRADQVATLTGGQRVGYIPSVNAYILRYPTTTADELNAKRQSVKSQPDVEVAAMPLGLLPACQDSTDRRYQRDLTEGRTGIWAWDRVQAPAAWRMLKGVPLSPVKVAVWDTGLDRNHVDFAGVNATMIDDTGAEVPYVGGDVLGHGTLVAGIIGAAANGVGIDGMMAPPLQQAGVPYTMMIFPLVQTTPTNVRAVFAHHLVHNIAQAESKGVRVFNVSAKLTVADLAARLETTAGAGAEALAIEMIKDNMFLFRKAMDVPGGRRILVVFAAGNDSTNLSNTDDNNITLFGSIHRFGVVDSVMVVGGISPDGNRWVSPTGGGSNAGSDEIAIDIAAPGELILGPFPKDSEFAANHGRIMRDLDGDPNSVYGITTGTSLSAPMVSAAAALVYSISNNPTLRAPAVKKLLQDNALRCRVDLRPGDKVNWRLLRMADTFAAMLPSVAANKSWSRLYATMNDQATGQVSLRKVKKIRRSGNTYVAQDVEIFLPDRFLGFSVSANGRSLVTPLHEGSGSNEQQHLYRYSLIDGSNSELVHMPYTFVDQPQGGGVFEKVSTSVAHTPMLFPSDDLFYLSNQTYQPYDPFDTSLRDRAPYEPYVLGYGALTSINRDQWKANTPGPAGQAVPTGSTVTVAEDLVFSRPTLTPDNRWILFSNGVSYVASEGSHIYLTFNPKVERPGFQDPLMTALVGQDKFLALSKADTDVVLDHASSPAISPDGSRLAYIDPRFNVEKPLRILKLRRTEGFGQDDKALIKPWHYTEEYQVPGKVFAFAWSPDGTHLIYLDRDDPQTVKIVSANLGEYVAGATPPAATPLITLSDVSSVRNLEWSWVEQ